MLELCFLSIIGFGLLCTAIAFRVARRAYWNHLMELHAQKVMGLDESHAD